MPVSPLQEIFLRELAANFQATHRRVMRCLADLPSNTAEAKDAVIRDELRGLYHAILVIFDGGTSLADHGLVSIVDERGVAFQRHLHEICFQYWPTGVSAEPAAAVDESAWR
jgi:hypothetical protein